MAVADETVAKKHFENFFGSRYLQEQLVAVGATMLEIKSEQQTVTLRDLGNMHFSLEVPEDDMTNQIRAAQRPHDEEAGQRRILLVSPAMCQPLHMKRQQYGISVSMKATLHSRGAART